MGKEESEKQTEEEDDTGIKGGKGLRVIKKSEKTIRNDTSKQSDKIYQNILNASKLLEGRISLEDLMKLDIPTFEALVNNEFANIDESYREFKEKGTINAYTKNETTNLDSKFLKEMQRQTSK